MRLDLILGILVSLLLHAGFVLGGQFFKEDPAPPKAETALPPTEVMIQPVIEPDEPPPAVTDISEPTAQSSDDLAPPMQADTPVVNVNSPFVQQMQPALPSSLSTPSTGAIRIPTTRATGGSIGARAGQLFDLSSLDQVPVPVFRVRPVYPYELQRAGTAGRATVEFIVDSTGRVSDARAVDSTHREFENPAVQAVLKWKFRPGRKGGAAVSTRMQINIAFDLNPS
jgi:protein TonB